MSDVKKIFTLFIIFIMLFNPVLAADTGQQKEKVIDGTKEKETKIINKDKSITGDIKVTTKDVSKFSVKKKSEYEISISKSGEHAKAKVSFPKSELQKIDIDKDGKFGLLHISDNGVVTHSTATEAELVAGKVMTFSTNVVNGYSGYEQYTFSDVESGNTLNIDDVSGNYTITGAVGGTIPSNNLTKYIIGYEWNTSASSPTLRTIDVNGNTFTPPKGYFDVHPIFGNMWRCTINATTGTITYGTNPRGDGLDLTGASGNVMVSIPKCYIKYAEVGALKRWWVSPYNYTGFEVDPAFKQRGGTERDVIFVSAYEASGFLDGSTFKLQSATNKQPVTGEVSYPNLPNSGRLYIGDAETYANNIGTGYGITNIHTLGTMRRLMYTEMGTLNSQAKLGNGVTNIKSGTGFAGRFTGANSTDTNINYNGTGTGIGTNGYVPVVYRGIENQYGNVWKWTIGINFNDTAHRIIKADGTGTMEAIMTVGNYEISTSDPLNTGTTTDGYQRNVFNDSILKNLMIVSSTTGGSSSTYLCDYYYLRAASSTPTCLFSGAAWPHGSYAGVGTLSSSGSSTYSARTIGSRLELIQNNYSKPNTDNGDTAIYLGTNGHYTGYNVSSGVEKVLDTDSTCTGIEYVDTTGGTHDVTITVYFTEDITVISDSHTATMQTVNISHTSSNTAQDGELIPYDILDEYFGTIDFDTTNPNATITRNATHFMVDTGYITANTTYYYNVSIPNYVEEMLWYDWNPDNETCNAKVQIGNSTPYTTWNITTYNVTNGSLYKLVYAGNGTEVGNATAANGSASIIILGLVDGAYWLTETSVLTGFVNVPAVAVVIIGAAGAFVGGSFINKWYRRRRGS